ncbi:MAG: PQQ-binding-like beta-propeller repeat protein [Armatimonadetes bacterium]|nr:PQQ-binding-like beta-propeller repeat protein [Armatimonadota bacterium]
MRSTAKYSIAAILVGFWLSIASIGSTEDWPMWRYDCERSACSPEELPRELYLQWVLELPRPSPCWPPTQHKLQFDLSYEPIVVGKMLIVPSMVSDSVTAYDTDTGKKAWRCYADGPVRFAPVGWHGRIYFVSDDGYLYCLDAATGKLVWKSRGGPSEHKLLGNERLISLWPARGAPVIYDGTVYFAASIWPFMGTFIHALDAESGEAVWTNSGSGSDFILQPHNSPAFAGVSPQGHLLATEDRLLVSGGRSVPAAYDRKTGRFLYFQTNTKLGGHAVYLGKHWFFNDGRMYEVSDGDYVAEVNASVITPDAVIGVTESGGIRASSLQLRQRYVDEGGKKREVAELPLLWKHRCDEPVEKIFMKAGPRLYAGRSDGFIAAIDFPAAPGTEKPAISWHTTVRGTPWSMLAGHGKLFVVTEEGRIYCFGGRATKAVVHSQATSDGEGRDAHWMDRARQILDRTDVHEGYCLVLGIGTGRLAEELARQSDLRVIGLDPDAEKVETLRARLDAAGLYGRRIALLEGDVLSLPIAPYLASLIVSEDPAASGLGGDGDFVQRVFRLLRPYGGVACLRLAGEARENLLEEARTAPLENGAVREEGTFVVLTRVGALPGSGDWTHQYGDVANTVCSTDQVVKPPLGLLWFGGPSHVDVLPRHGHGPPEQVVGGRLFIEGIDVMSARDVYTGRVLWRRELPGLATFGMYYDETFNPDPYDRSYNQVHIPGANAYGSNFVATADEVYVAKGQTCLVLEAASGETLREYRLPSEGTREPPNWGYLGVSGDLLIAGAAPLGISEEDGKVVVEPNRGFAVGSQYLVVMDRHTGRVLWQRKAAHNFRHNAIVASRDRLFCIDGLSQARLALMKRRGLLSEAKPVLLALDLSTGDEIWRVEDGVFGTWLAYSEEYNVLLQASSRSSDRAADETGKSMSVCSAADGKLLWQNDESYYGPCILHHDIIITQPGYSPRYSIPAKAFELLSGEVVTCPHPLTGEDIPWGWIRFYGCNTAIGSEHLLTFRSASAAYAELPAGHSTTSIGGFKSGCTSNLVVANGVLNAPDYTRTCTCSYQNQTSLALYHAPAEYPTSADVEGWCFTYYRPPDRPTPVSRVGINFGAPGDRHAESGTLWLDFPSVGGPSPDIPVSIEGSPTQLFRFHMSHLKQHGEDALRWVGASGIEGATAVTLRPFVQPAAVPEDGKVHAFQEDADGDRNRKATAAVTGRYEIPRPYTVRLYFAEPEDFSPGERVFDVFIQGQEVLSGLDVARSAGGPRRAIIREFHGIEIEDDLRIALKPSVPPSSHRPILCGIELLAED